jgi:hypothetical protein
MPCSFVIYSNPSSISSVNGEIHEPPSEGSGPVRRVSMFLDFSTNSTKVSFTNIDEDRQISPRHLPNSSFEMEKFSSVGASHSITPPSSQSDTYSRPQFPESNVCRDVMVKLLFFTFAMILLPLGTYWFTFNYVFEGHYSPPPL